MSIFLIVNRVRLPVFLLYVIPIFNEGVIEWHDLLDLPQRQQLYLTITSQPLRLWVSNETTAPSRITVTSLVLFGSIFIMSNDFCFHSLLLVQSLRLLTPSLSYLCWYRYFDCLLYTSAYIKKFIAIRTFYFVYSTSL